MRDHQANAAQIKYREEQEQEREQEQEQEQEQAEQNNGTISSCNNYTIPSFLDILLQSEFRILHQSPPLQANECQQDRDHVEPSGILVYRDPFRTNMTTTKNNKNSRMVKSLQQEFDSYWKIWNCCVLTTTRTPRTNKIPWYFMTWDLEKANW